MKRVALELVDAGLQIVSQRGQLSRPSPGLALVDGGELAVGLDAESIARLKPRRLHSRFWQDLGTSPLGRPFPGYLRTADLAHAHLKSVWDSDGDNADEVVVAVPGTLGDDQLSLFLGIAAELGVPVRGLVDAAVAAAADRESGPHCLHLDIHLHQAVLTEIEHGDEIVRGAVRVDQRVGLLGLRDIWARVIARTFVHATRFDPLHLAATEQVLYAHLADHVEALVDRESTNVRISSGGRQHAVEIDRNRIVNAASQAYDTLISLVQGNLQSEEVTVLLGHRAASLPGFADRLRENLELTVVALHPAVAAGGALTHAGLILSEEPSLPFVTRLPGYDARPPGPVTVPVTPPADSVRQLPSHLVVDGVAVKIGSEELVLGAEGLTDGVEEPDSAATVRRLAGQAVLDAPPHAGVTINGEPFEGRTALAPGDRLSVGRSDRQILVVTMAD
jgi:hypothetical protein